MTNGDSMGVVDVDGAGNVVVSDGGGERVGERGGGYNVSLFDADVI